MSETTSEVTLNEVLQVMEDTRVHTSGSRLIDELARTAREIHTLHPLSDHDISITDACRHSRRACMVLR